MAFTVCGFNPHAREGRDIFSRENITNQDVSIHTPVKGATTGVFWLHVGGNVSIHTPVKGATC